MLQSDSETDSDAPLPSAGIRTPREGELVSESDAELDGCGGDVAVASVGAGEGAGEAGERAGEAAEGDVAVTSVGAGEGASEGTGALQSSDGDSAGPRIYIAGHEMSF